MEVLSKVKEKGGALDTKYWALTLPTPNCTYILKNMTQFPHDDFVKEYLPELCNDYGTATPSVDVKGETRQI